MHTPLRIGLFGFGCVGQGLYDVLRRTPGLRANIAMICVKNQHKPRTLDASIFTYQAADLIDDPDIDIIVELIDDAEAAFDIAKRSMRAGKAVVTANKHMVATRLSELLTLQNETGQSLLYEASTCGSIPIIRNLEEYYDNDLLDGVTGIVNGTTNVILTRLASAAGSGLGYGDALEEAIALGFAESDPTLDVEAYDAAFKTAILSAHAFGVVIDPASVVRRGITSIAPFDVRIAASQGYVIKLLARVFVSQERLTAIAMPAFVSVHDPLASINNEVNAVRLDAAFSEAQMLVGKGAGGGPTASAVLSDISALRYGYRYEYRKLQRRDALVVSNSIPVVAYVRGPRPVIEAVPWLERRIDVRSADGHYVVGVVDLGMLQTSFAFGDPSTVVALLPDNHALTPLDHPFRGSA